MPLSLCLPKRLSDACDRYGCAGQDARAVFNNACDLDCFSCCLGDAYEPVFHWRSFFRDAKGKYMITILGLAHILSLLYRKRLPVIVAFAALERACLGGRVSAFAF